MFEKIKRLFETTAVKLRLLTRMKKLLVLSAVLLGTAVASQAGIDVHIGIPLPPLPGIVIGRPAPPVVVHRPPVVYAPPPPVYYAPPPVVYAPPPRVIYRHAPHYSHWHGHRGHGHGHGHHHHR